MAEPTPNERAARLEVQVERLIEDVEKLTKAVSELTGLMNQAKGGWKAMLAVGAISGTLGAAIVKLVPMLAALPK